MRGAFIDAVCKLLAIGAVTILLNSRVFEHAHTRRAMEITRAKFGLHGEDTRAVICGCVLLQVALYFVERRERTDQRSIPAVCHRLACEMYFQL